MPCTLSRWGTSRLGPSMLKGGGSFTIHDETSGPCAHQLMYSSKTNSRAWCQWIVCDNIWGKWPTNSVVPISRPTFFCDEEDAVDLEEWWSLCEKVDDMYPLNWLGTLWMFGSFMWPSPFTYKTNLWQVEVPYIVISKLHTVLSKPYWLSL
jgi:hypothetical protein